MFVVLATLIPPVRPPVTVGITQLYKVPAGTIPFIALAGVKLNETPLQITALNGLIAATGLTVTVKEKALPAQLPATGVMV